MKLVAPLLLVVTAFTVIACVSVPLYPRTPMPTLAECRDIAVAIVDSAPNVSDITLVEEISRTRTLLVCKGLAHFYPKGTEAVILSQGTRGIPRIISLSLDDYECAYIIPEILELSEEKANTPSIQRS